MKISKIIASLALFAAIFASCKNEVAPEVKTVDVEKTEATQKIDPNATIAMAEFNIEGMTCAIGCAKTIEKKLSAMEGVKSAKVDYDNKLAMVAYDDAKVTTTSLEETVTKVGDAYSVHGMKTVESFSSNGAKAEHGHTEHGAHDHAKKEGKKACSKECKKECCAKKA